MRGSELLTSVRTLLVTWLDKACPCRHSWQKKAELQHFALLMATMLVHCLSRCSEPVEVTVMPGSDNTILVSNKMVSVSD